MLGTNCTDNGTREGFEKFRRAGELPGISTARDFDSLDVLRPLGHHGTDTHRGRSRCCLTHPLWHNLACTHTQPIASAPCSCR